MPRALLIPRATWALAAISLAVGVWRSLAPEAQVDFTRVMEWVDMLVRGVPPWPGEPDADYPPWAIAILTPMALVPASWRLPAWIVFNIGLSLWLAHTLAEDAEEPREIQRGLFALLLATSPFRVFGQFSILSFSLAWAGARDRVAWRGGLLLGLALMKPHVGGVVWAAHVLRRDWLRVIVAAAVPLTLLVMVAAWIDATPLGLLGDYRTTLEMAQGGSAVFAGHTELEPWLAPWIPGVTSIAGTVAVAALLFLPVIVVAPRTPRLELYALCGVVSLLSARHLSYDFLLVLPLVVAWRTPPFGTASIGMPWRVAWFGLVTWLVAQPMGWWRRVVEPMGLADPNHWVLGLDRGLCVVLFWLILWRCMRLNMTK